MIAEAWQPIVEDFRTVTGWKFRPSRIRYVHSGCISEAAVLADGDRRVFVKSNEAAFATFFEAEAEGLQELRASDTLRTPEVIGRGTIGERSWLALEYVEFRSPAANGPAELGAGLANLHRCTRERFGWHRDNAIGSTPQPNPPSDDWIAFFREHRLGFQFDLARSRGRTFGRSDEVLERMGEWFVDYRPVPVLLHGDLWSGNAGFAVDGTPVVYDPAVYYGDREAEFGIIEMFGGYDPAFFRAYHQSFPWDGGYEIRKRLYLLYHQLNHYNLFGESYASQIDGSIAMLLRA